MGCLGNLLWLIFGGLASSLSWCLAGCVWCITIIGIPIGMQCFKLAYLSFCPFGKEVYYSDSVASVLPNVIWLLGFRACIGPGASCLWRCSVCYYIGIPFGIQHFKLAKLALMPFGAEIE